MNGLSRVIALIMLGILVVGGLLASVFAHAIETALTVPSSNSVPRSSTLPLPTRVPTTAAAAPVGTQFIAPTPTAVRVLSQDTFQRADQVFWGTASDGQAWGGDAAAKNAFAIAGRTGQVANGQGTFDATLGPVATDAEVQFTGSINQFHQSNFGAVLRWTDTNDWYKAYIDGTRLIVIKRVAGMVSRLGAAPFAAQAGVIYTLRFRAIGTTLAAKVWPTGNAEPPNWMVTLTDTAFQSGYAGLRVLLGNGIIVHITSFKATAPT